MTSSKKTVNKVRTYKIGRLVAMRFQKKKKHFRAIFSQSDKQLKERFMINSTYNNSLGVIVCGLKNVIGTSRTSVGPCFYSAILIDEKRNLRFAYN